MALSHTTSPSDNSPTSAPLAPTPCSLNIRTGVTVRMAVQRCYILRQSLPEFEKICSRFFHLPPSFGNGERTRFYPRDRTFFMFLKQILDAQGSCEKSVMELSAWLDANHEPVPSANTAGYCKARGRLIEQDLQVVHGILVTKALENISPQQRWCSRIVKVVDGSTVSLPDTKQNQAMYPQPTSQKQGCGFPIVRRVTVFLLATGTMVDAAWGAAYGPRNVSERELYHSLWDGFQPGEVVLGDRGFCSWADVWGLLQHQVDSVVRRLHRQECPVVARLGEGDRLVRWYKPKTCPKWMDPQSWQAAPEFFLVREVTFHVGIPGFRTRTVTLVTTLLDPKAFTKKALAELYRLRWMCELWLRDIKIAMNMDILTCESPAMVHKEIWMHIIGYNVVRGVMNAASKAHAVPLYRIGFTRTMAALRIRTAPLANLGSHSENLIDPWEALLCLITRRLLPDRPNRKAVRAVKRRPKGFPRLNKPRHQFKEIPHRSRYKATAA